MTKNDDPTKPTKKDDQKTDVVIVQAETVESHEKTSVEAQAVNNHESSNAVMTDYDDRLEAKRERLEDRASKKRTESENTFKRSQELVAGIEMGQPVLVGHHSERRHRNALDKSWAAIGKSVELDKIAGNLEDRAASVGSGGISSNEPEALTKLSVKLEAFQKLQITMTTTNKIIRLSKLSEAEKIAEIVEKTVLNEEQARDMLKPDHVGRIGFAAYALQNNNAQIRRIKQRIESIEKLRTSEGINFENDDFSMTMNNGQFVVNFSHGKPSDETRHMLKRLHSFKWSRTQGAWVRKITPNAMYAGLSVLEALKASKNMY